MQSIITGWSGCLGEVRDADSGFVDWLQVIQTICEGIVAFLMERSDHAKVMMRSVARELLATCVFRALMGLLTPYNINKAFLCS